KFMTMTKLKTSVIGAIVAVTIATPLLLRHEAEIQLRNQGETLRQQTDQLAALQKENTRLSNLLAQANTGQALTKDQLSELMRLRGEVSMLRSRTNEPGKLRPSRESSPTATPPSEAVNSQTI